MKSPQKECYVFKILCYFSIAINLLMFFILDSKINEVDFTVDAIFLVLFLAVEGFDRGYIAIMRKDFAVWPTFIGTVIVSTVIIIEAYRNISIGSAILILFCLIIQCLLLIVLYCKILRVR